MKPLRRLTLDDKGDCIAEEIRPGIWHIHQVSSFGTKRTIILTIETIKYLAEQA
jgi:hypothetical protein